MKLKYILEIELNLLTLVYNVIKFDTLNKQKVLSILSWYRKTTPR